jgi:hypothetical protein
LRITENNIAKAATFLKPERWHIPVWIKQLELLDYGNNQMEISSGTCQ